MTMPRTISGETAERIKERIKQCGFHPDSL